MAQIILQPALRLSDQGANSQLIMAKVIGIELLSSWLHVGEIW